MVRVIDSETNDEEHYFTEYKVVEVSSVTDQEIEAVLNRFSLDGWSLDGIQFAMRDSSKRPSMAFVLFTRSARIPANLKAVDDLERDVD